MKHFLSWLQLVRLPAVFTAMADIALGFLLVHSSFAPAGLFLLILGSSALLYLSGMLWNDFFDRAEDAKHRENRPIPSGAISVQAAASVGTILTLCGIAFAALAGVASFAVAVILTFTIFVYDAGGKRTVLGPILMGACRSLNVLLGASAGQDHSFLLAVPPTLGLIALALGLYIAGVTWFAQSEAGTKNKAGMTLGIGVIILGLLLLCVVCFLYTQIAQPLIAIVMIGFIGFTILRRANRAIHSQESHDVQIAVKLMLLSYVVLIAVMVFAVTGTSVVYAIATAALLLPTMTLGRFLTIT